MARSRFKIADDILKKICEKLIRWDPDIVEVVQFGSSIYTPEFARDLDLLVFTKRRKDYGVYLDATCEAYDELALPHNIDVVPCEVGKQLNESLAVQVRGAYRVLYGDGSFLKEATNWAIKRLVERFIINPTFEEAHVVIRSAQDYMNLASSTEDLMLRDRHIRETFDGLFHAARIASMAYLSTEETRWGRVRKRLPSPHEEEFREITDTLHIKYFYEGNYPHETVEEEFQRQLERVEAYIKRLEEARSRKDT